MSTNQNRAHGAQSMTANLARALVKRPDASFGEAFDNPDLGFLHRVDLAEAQRQHDAFCAILTDLGVDVAELATEGPTGDAIYTFDPLLIANTGAIPLRPGKPNRLGEELAIERWANEHGIPTVGRIEAPGTVDGGDTMWLRPDLFVIGRSLRTNRAGADQLQSLVESETLIVDVPYATGPAECLHLLSVISPVADDLAVVFLPQLPAGLYDLLQELGIRTISVPEHEMPSLGCNVLAVRPGVVVMAEGNPITQQGLLDAGCEVHTFAGSEVAVNGSGGPTCMTRPILRG